MNKYKAKKAFKEKLEKELAPKRTKFKRARKPMSDEQRAAASERLAKARAARKAKNGDSSPKYIAPEVHKLPDDHPLSVKNVRDWIKHNKELLSEERKAVRNNVKGAIAKAASIEKYIRNLERYIRTGDYVDMFYGKEQGKKIKYKVVVNAYHHEGPYKGMIKRMVGHIYDDVGEWTQEMHDEYYSINKSKTLTRRSKNVRGSTVSRKTSKKRKTRTTKNIKASKS